MSLTWSYDYGIRTLHWSLVGLTSGHTSGDYASPPQKNLLLVNRSAVSGRDHEPLLQHGYEVMAAMAAACLEDGIL